MKKCLQILLFYTWVPKVTIISCMVPGYMEHKGQTFLSFWTIFCPFTPLTTQKPKFLKKWKKNIWRYYHFKICTINDNHMMYGSWDMETNRQNFLSFWTIFLHFWPPKHLKNQNFEAMKKMPQDIIILQKCMKNHDHMLYCSWDMSRDGCNYYFSFWAIFCPFILITAKKNKNFKKKKHLEI